MSRTLAILARAPAPGRVKTRLIDALGAEGAAALYEACLQDVVERAASVGAALHLFHDTAPGAASYFQAAFPAIPRSPQAEGDLGARLRQAFADLFAAGAEQVAMIGADSPTLPPAFLAEGLSALATHDVTLGPAADGGYYLVGIRGTAWPRAGRLFESIPWSTERVRATTLERAAAAGVDVHILPAWYDIDRPDDLGAALADAAEGSHLARFLEHRPDRQRQ